MNYEEKYKEMKARVLEIGRGYVNGVDFSKPRQIAEYIDPDLKESEDERIRKDIVAAVETYGDFTQGRKEEIYTWLKKQGEQNNNEDMDILHRFSFYSYKDEPNVLYLSGLYVNEEYRNRGIGTKILKIADKVSTSMECNYIRLKTESGGDAERLYKENGYNTLKKEGNQVWLEKQCEQKPTYEVKPKFNVDDWIISNKHSNYGNSLMRIVEVRLTDYLCQYYNGQTTYCHEFIDKNYHLWTIQDAKNGDVLVYPDGTIVLFKYRLDGLNSGIYMSNILLATEIEVSQSCAVSKDLHPATKEQRDLLFQKMKEAGYEWDAEKKELKNIAKMKTTEWSEEDEKIWLQIINEMEAIKSSSSTIFEKNIAQDKIDWLKSLRPQPKQEWSEEDEKMLLSFLHKVEVCDLMSNKESTWILKKLKSLKPNHWKPSEEHMKVLKQWLNEHRYDGDSRYIYGVINSLYEQLKTL